MWRWRSSTPCVIRNRLPLISERSWRHSRIHTCNNCNNKDDRSPIGAQVKKVRANDGEFRSVIQLWVSNSLVVEIQGQLHHLSTQRCREITHTSSSSQNLLILGCSRRMRESIFIIGSGGIISNFSHRWQWLQKISSELSKISSTIKRHFQESLCCLFWQN